MVTTATRKKALAALLARRGKLQAAYDALIAAPESYGITGSVNAVNRKLDAMRAEIAAVDARIGAVASGGTLSGVSLALPNYRRNWED